MKTKSTNFKETEIGLIPEEWGASELGDLLSLIIDHRGLTPKKLGGDWSSVGIQAISAMSIKGGRLVSLDESKFVDEILYKKWMPVELEANDVLLTSEAPLGETYLIKKNEKFCLSQRLFALRTKKDILDPGYLFYFLHSPKGKQELHGRATGSVVTGIRQSELVKIEVDLPPITEQRRIASILSSLDDKIELNRQINANLEKMASTLFKRWFVDFEFPDENGKPYKSSGGKMVESEMGEIPEGWRVGKMNDLVRVESGFPFHSNMFDNAGSYELVTIKNVQDGLFVPECTDRLKEIPVKMPEHCKLKSGDILLSLTGNVGRVCVVYGQQFLLNQRVAILTPVEETNRAFTYALFRRDEFQNNLINISRGTAQQNLSPIETKNLDLTIPTKEVLAHFGDAMNCAFEAMVDNLDEIKILSTIRDSLSPRLMSGKIRTI